jgi:hypothetical protein
MWPYACLLSLSMMFLKIYPCYSMCKYFVSFNVSNISLYKETTFYSSVHQLMDIFFELFLFDYYE